MKSKFFYWLAILIASWSITAADIKVSQTNYKVGVFGGGGVNFASLLMAEKFCEAVGKKFEEIFDLNFAISGGASVATLLKHKQYGPSASKVYREVVGKAFFEPTSFANDPTDGQGKRRNHLKQVFETYFAGMMFGPQANNKLVYVASTPRGRPIFYCDPEISLSPNELRCMNETPLIDGMLNSSAYKTPDNSFILQPGNAVLLPNLDDFMIQDGGNCNAKDGDRFILDGFTPTPLAIEYLKKIPGRHNIVVFGNGGPINEEFRAAINLNEQKTAVIEESGSFINIYILSPQIDEFIKRSIDSSSENLDYLHDRTIEAIGGQAKEAFEAAVKSFRQQD